MSESPHPEGMFGVDIGRSFVKGSLVGFGIVFLVTGGIALNAGAPLASAGGLGLFAGFWGGPGFGGMLGAVSGASRVPAPADEAPRREVAMAGVDTGHAPSGGPPDDDR